jgi:hypothetical protein
VKIEWLNDELSEARLFRGVLWWKRVAHIKRTNPLDYRSRRWRHHPSGNICGESEYVDGMRDAEFARRSEMGDWQPIRPLPRARLVRGDS